jgi:hypothetical protein
MRGAWQVAAQHVAMYDSAAFLALTIASGLAVVTSLAALFWAAVQDGRDEREFRLHHDRSTPNTP